METWIVVGAAVVAVAPRIPGLRRVAKSAVRVGSSALEKGRDVAVEAGEHWADLIAEARSDSDAQPVVDDTVAVPVTYDAESAA